ncbi:hypothetical protein WA171_002137 [Blastocystis sp. BT1]
MGNQQAKLDLRPRELKELQDTTKFTEEEIYMLYDAFKSISSSRVDDGVIDEQEFRQLVGMKEGFFFERIFSMFDKNSDGQIVFTEFVKCLAFLTSRVPPDDRLQCLFRFYDLKQDNEISREELKRITEAMFFQYGKVFSDEMLNSIVDETFQILEIEKDGSISFDQFCKIPHIGDPIIELPF